MGLISRKPPDLPSLFLPNGISAWWEESDFLSFQQSEGFEMALTIGRTKDGHPAVKIRHMTFAMLPGRNSPLAIFSLWPAKNPENCIREDFSSFDRTVESEKEFVSYMEELAEHYEIGRAHV